MIGRHLVRVAAFATAGALAAGLVACGGGSYSAPSTTPSTTPTAPGATRSVAITAAGLNPRQLRVEPGERVTFTNNDSRPHEMRSSPHPTHTDCPPLNETPILQPGQSGQTGALTRTGTCNYHDNMNEANAALQGQILIGVEDPGPNPGYSMPGSHR